MCHKISSVTLRFPAFGKRTPSDVFRKGNLWKILLAAKSLGGRIYQSSKDALIGNRHVLQLFFNDAADNNNKDLRLNLDGKNMFGVFKRLASK